MSALVYEITATVRDALTAAFEEYMTDRHIPDVMATGAFESSTFTRSETGRYRISYKTSRKALDEYLSDQAQRLRSHVVCTFPEGVELSREEWGVIAVFEK